MLQQYTLEPDGGFRAPPLFLVEEITHRVLNEYTEAIASLTLAAAAAPDIRSQGALTSAAPRLRTQAEAHRAFRRRRPTKVLSISPTTSRDFAPA